MHQVVKEAIYKRLLFGHCKKGGGVNRNLDFLADLGKARGSSTNSFVVDSFINLSYSSHRFTAPPRPNR